MAVQKKKIALGGCATTVLVFVVALLWLNHLLFDRTPGQYFDSNGLKIYYTDEGNKNADALILIHGLAAHSDINWRRPGINALLAPDFRVVALDLRGHGLSDHPHDPKAYGIEMVEDITRLMDHLGIQKAHVAGYSLGGFLALKFGVLHPERCLSLEICASGWKDPDSLEPLRSPYADDPDTRLPDDPKKHDKLIKKAAAFSQAKLGADCGTGNQEFVGDSGICRIEDNRTRSCLQALHPNPINPKIPVELLKNGRSLTPGRQPILEASILPDVPTGFDPIRQIRSYFGDRVVDRDAIRALKENIGIFAVTADQLKACKIPTLCLIGTRDGLKPYALDLKKAMPQCELVLIEGSNHITTVMYGEFQLRLKKFLLEHRVLKG